MRLSRYRDKFAVRACDGQAERSTDRAAGFAYGFGYRARRATIVRLLPTNRGADVDFGFTEEQLMIQDVARRIAQEKIAPSAEHHDRSGEFPLDNIRNLGEKNGRATGSTPDHNEQLVRR